MFFIRCLQFNDKGNILYGSAVDFLGVYGIEPTTVYDTLTLKWGNMNEFVVKGDKIVSSKLYIIYTFNNNFIYLNDLVPLFRWAHLIYQQMFRHG